MGQEDQENLLGINYTDWAQLLLVEMIRIRAYKLLKQPAMHKVIISLEEKNIIFIANTLLAELRQSPDKFIGHMIKLMVDNFLEEGNSLRNRINQAYAYSDVKSTFQLRSEMVNILGKEKKSIEGIIRCMSDPDKFLGFAMQVVIVMQQLHAEDREPFNLCTMNSALLYAQLAEAICIFNIIRTHPKLKGYTVQRLHHFGYGEFRQVLHVRKALTEHSKEIGDYVERAPSIRGEEIDRSAKQFFRMLGIIRTTPGHPPDSTSKIFVDEMGNPMLSNQRAHFHFKGEKGTPEHVHR